MRPNNPPRTTPEQTTHGATIQPHDGRDRLIRLPEVQARTGLGKSSIYAGVRVGTFPAPVRLSARAVAWRESGIDRWIADRLTTGGA